MSDPSAGWHPDPEQPGQLRYWDGSQWTEHRQPAGPTAPPPLYGQQGYGQPAYGMPAAPTPFVPTGGPAPSSGSGCAKIAIIVVVVVLILGGIATVSLFIVGKKVVDSVERSFGTAKQSDYSITNTKCENSGSYINVSGTFTNKAHHHQAYYIEVEADDRSGARVGTGYELIEGLNRDQSASFTVTDVGATPSSGVEGLTCKVVDVSYRPG